MEQKRRSSESRIKPMKPSSPLYLLWLLVLCAGVVACTDREAMQERLAYVSACNRADTVFSARWVPTVDSLVEFFDRHGSPNDRMMAHYLQGRVHHDMGEAPRAIDCYQKAVSCADTLAQDCDYHTLAAVYGQMSILFHEQFLPDDEIVALNSLAKSARLDHDTLTEIVAIDRLTNSYFMKGDTDSVIIVEKLARELYLKNGYKEYAGQAVLGSIWIELNRHNLSETERLLNIYRNESGLFDDNSEPVRPSAYYVDKGVYMTQVGNLDSAQYYFRKAVGCGMYEGGYKGLLAVYEKLNRSDSVAKYARLYAAANDSSFLHVNQEAVHRISALYNYSRQQKIAEEQAEKARAESRKKKILMGVVLLLIAAAFYFRRRYMEKKHTLDKLKSEFAEATDRYDKNLQTLQALEDDHRAMIAQVKDELSEENARLKAKIEEMVSQSGISSSVRKMQSFMESPIARRLMELRDKPLSPMTEQDKEMLVDTTRQFYPSFLYDLQHAKNITPTGVCVGILSAMNFRSGDIANLLDLSFQQVSNIKKSISLALFNEKTARSLYMNLVKHYDFYQTSML